MLIHDACFFLTYSFCVTDSRFIHLTRIDSYLLVRTILIHPNLGWLCDLLWLIKCPKIDGMLVLHSSLKRPWMLSPLSWNQPTSIRINQTGWEKPHSPVFPITQAQTVTNLVSKTLQNGLLLVNPTTDRRCISKSAELSREQSYWASPQTQEQ